ncbi:hypothetical protein [Streptomyces sp. NPDC057702]|uniref:hypothetical protein n=1 Tax=unclassified Streptomyces TaxID=2593676 RepID=UPI00369353A3
MSERPTIGRELRIFGALYCAVFAAISLAWIIRDLDQVDETSYLWWNWAGLSYHRYSDGVVTSSYYDLVLLVLYVVTGLIVTRSAVAGSALVTVAVTTIVLRLPSLWNLHSDWMDGIPGGIATRAQLTCWSAVLVSAGVLAAVAASRSRQPAPAPDRRYGTTPPARYAEPTPGGARAACALLGGVGLVLIAWEIYYARKWGWEAYERQLTGERYLVAVLGQPGAWVRWFIALLAVTAAVLTPRRAPFVRPLGLVAAFLVVAHSVSDVSVIFKLDLLDHLDDVPTNGKLAIYSAFAQVLAGLVALLALATPGPEHVAGPPAPWDPPPGGYATPDGYGPGHSPRGYPSGSGQRGDPRGGGYQGGYQGGGPYGGGSGHPGGPYGGDPYGGGHPGAQGGGYGPPPPPSQSPPVPPPPPNPPPNPPGW